MKYNLKLTKTIPLLLFSGIIFQNAYGLDQYDVSLKEASYPLVKSGPNISGADGCYIDGFASKLEKDIKADPIFNKISLKYNARTAVVDANSYAFYLANKDGKKLYSANKYADGLLLAPYRFIEITGSMATKKSKEIMLNKHKYQVSDIWFSSVCFNQKDCQNYAYTSVGFVNPSDKKGGICYVYSKPYAPAGSASNIPLPSVNKANAQARTKQVDEKCGDYDINGNCVK